MSVASHSLTAYQTPLVHAIYRNDEALVELILSQNPDLSIRDPHVSDVIR